MEHDEKVVEEVVLVLRCDTQMVKDAPRRENLEVLVRWQCCQRKIVISHLMFYDNTQITVVGPNLGVERKVVVIMDL